MPTKELKQFYNEPYYPPGYCGYSPQFHFKYGETYGKTTSRLLTDPSVAKSKRSVLVDITSIDRAPPLPQVFSREKSKRSWGDVKLSERMVPGYTGYIPKKEDHFGGTYGDVCRSAISNFENDQNIYINKRRQLIQPKKSMKQIRPDAKPYVSLNEVHHSVSPYFMNTSAAEKTFMSGYTGFIPRSRARFAVGYPKLTQQALGEFTRAQQIRKTYARKPIVISESGPNRYGHNPTDSVPESIYIGDGLLPNYTGYLPSDKFRFGLTFGASSRYYHAVNQKQGALQPIF